jgi:hypothetical protein
VPSNVDPSRQFGVPVVVGAGKSEVVVGLKVELDEPPELELETIPGVVWLSRAVDMTEAAVVVDPERFGTVVETGLTVALDETYN